MAKAANLDGESDGDKANWIRMSQAQHPLSNQFRRREDEFWLCVYVCLSCDPSFSQFKSSTFYWFSSNSRIYRDHTLFFPSFFLHSRNKWNYYCFSLQILHIFVFHSNRKNHKIGMRIVGKSIVLYVFKSLFPLKNSLQKLKKKNF